MNLSLKTIISTLVLSLTFYSFTNSASTTKRGIDFYNGTYQEALEKAKKEKKLVFIYLYANWCGVCKSLKKKTLRNENVGNFYNKEYISLALNGEKGEGAEIAKSIGLQSYPTLLYLDGGNGRILNRISGFKSPIEFINLGKIFTQE
ncbi:thioredoxin family protein [Mesonia aquimarina]|uniref:thioredoxin family protein n=1 Tax=Mesonia aquimarina TaxID=1504967 RepID=UPI000EF5D2A1|nr:thioredoxin family protein [Mesonia aquimarina]